MIKTKKIEPSGGAIFSKSGAKGDRYSLQAEINMPGPSHIGSPGNPNLSLADSSITSIGSSLPSIEEEDEDNILTPQNSSENNSSDMFFESRNQ